MRTLIRIVGRIQIKSSNVHRWSEFRITSEPLRLLGIFVRRSSMFLEVFRFYAGEVIGEGGSVNFPHRDEERGHDRPDNETGTANEQEATSRR